MQITRVTHIACDAAGDGSSNIIQQRCTNMSQPSDVTIAQSARVCHMPVEREFITECHAETRIWNMEDCME